MPPSFTGVLHTWGFALYLASREKSEDDFLPTGLPFLREAGALMPYSNASKGILNLLGSDQRSKP